jgi:dephospho-CoA kinase
MRRSRVAKMLCRLGVPVSDTDAIVHGLISSEDVAEAAVELAFLGPVENDRVNKVKLNAKILENCDAFKRNGVV